MAKNSFVAEVTFKVNNKNIKFTCFIYLPPGKIRKQVDY